MPESATYTPLDSDATNSARGPLLGSAVRGSSPGKTGAEGRSKKKIDTQKVRQCTLLPLPRARLLVPTLARPSVGFVGLDTNPSAAIAEV